MNKNIAINEGTMHVTETNRFNFARF